MADLTRGIVRAAKKSAPYGEHLARWWLIALGVFFLVLELDHMWDGAVYGLWKWFWDHVLARHPSVAWIAGMLSYYLVLRERRRRQVIERCAEPRINGETPINMSVKALGSVAEEMKDRG